MVHQRRYCIISFWESASSEKKGKEGMCQVEFPWEEHDKAIMPLLAKCCTICIVLLSCYLLCFKKCTVKRIHFMNYDLELKMTFIISQSGWNNHDDTIWFYYLLRILNHHGYVLFSCYSRAGKWHLWLLPLSLWLDLGLTMTRGGLPKLNSSES